MKPIIVGMHEAKTHFSRLVRDAAAGREVIVENGGKPVAKIVRYTPQNPPRKPGRLAGKIRIKRGFDDLPPGFEDAFAGE